LLVQDFLHERTFAILAIPRLSKERPLAYVARWAEDVVELVKRTRLKRVTGCAKQILAGLQLT
jgi:hypothetical protein